MNENFIDKKLTFLQLEKTNEEVEDNIKNTFKYAKLLMPSIIILEDIDKFFTKSDDEATINFDDKKTKLLYSLVHEIENVWAQNSNPSDSQNTKTPNNKVLLISTCTNIDKVELELRKPGNLDYVISFGPPNQPQRKRLFAYFSKFFNHALYEEDLEILADKSHGFVPTDIIQIFK